MYTHIYVCMYIYIYIYMHNSYMYAYVYIYIYIYIGYIGWLIGSVLGYLHVADATRTLDPL